MSTIARSIVILFWISLSSSVLLAQKEATQETGKENRGKANENVGDEKGNPSKDAKNQDPPSSARKSADKKPIEKQTAKETIRLVELSGSYLDLVQPIQLDPTSLLLGGDSMARKSFYRLCSYLEEVAKEENVRCIVFDLSDAGIDMNSAQLDEWSRRLERLKASGKKTIAWLENPRNVHLSIASGCHEILLADFGVVDMPSLSMQTMFYRDAMDLVGIQASVVRAGEFKGAVEPYLNPEMSDHLRKHYQEMLHSMNEAHVDRIARGRALPHAQVRELQRKRLFLPSEALAKGLVDQLVPYGQMREAIEKRMGSRLEWSRPKAAPKREISFFDLMGKLMSGDKKGSSAVKESTIAVLHLSGPIEDGKKDSPGSVVSGPTIKTIEELANDEKIRGVVVRINSPGGSATASEAIRSSLASLAEKKPTVVSMGEMAASGGYWISCIGVPIYAEKGTITGSIGVFSLKLSFGGLMRRVGVRVESVALDESAKSDALDRAWTDHDVDTMQSFIDDVYGKFLKLASKSRDVPLEVLKELAGGRVWSGSQAKQHRLVDEIGGLDDCLAAVAKKAKLEKFEVVHRPVLKSGLDLLELLGESDPTELKFSERGVEHFLNLLHHPAIDKSVPQMLLRQSVENPRIQAWALSPCFIRVR